LLELSFNMVNKHIQSQIKNGVYSFLELKFYWKLLPNISALI
jgi:hypothetical protein